MAQSRASSDADPDRESDEDALALRGFMRGTTLRGVLAIGQVQRTDRAELALLSLESYDDGFMIRYRIMSKSPTRRDLSSAHLGGMHPDLLFGRVQDNRGGTYEGFPGGGGGDGDQWHGEARFSPEFADGTTAIEIEIQELQWMSWMPGQRSFAESGPWIFRIPLANMVTVTS